MSRRMGAQVFTVVTTAIVLLFALAEWAAEKFVSGRSRAEGTALEIAIVLVAALAFRPIHQRIEAAVEGIFTRRKREALAALERFRRELSAFRETSPMLHRAIETIDRYMEVPASAVYVRHGTFTPEVSSFAVTPGVDLSDPQHPRCTPVSGTRTFPMMVTGELIGLVCVQMRDGGFDDDELRALHALAADLARVLATLDPALRPRKRTALGNLPADLPELVGRDREVADVGAALTESRLVTLTGAGGVGKTHLAMHCAAAAIEHFDDGVWFVNLSPIADANLIAPTILAAMDAKGQGNDATRLIDYLRNRCALLVMDNCEHIVAGVAEIVSRVRAHCPQMTILATSRELLHLDGERVYRVASLQTTSAMELFAKRAKEVSPDFDLARHDRVVRTICEHLDGIPLAIELAASRARALTVEETLEHLSERLRLLEGGTLAATMEWSYGILPEQERSIFRRLSAFRGSFSLAAAASVCSSGGECDELAVHDMLTSLADKSLLTIVPGIATRYRLLETIREFASAKSDELDEAAGAARLHAEFYAELAAHAYHEFDTRLPKGWLSRLSPEIDEFRGALEFTLAGEGDRRNGAQMAADCGPIFLRLELLPEGLYWCEAARSVSGLAPQTTGRIEYVASMMHNNLGETRAALACALRAGAAYEQSNDTRGHIRALSQLANQYARSNRFGEAQEPAREALRRARELGEPRLLIAVLRRCALALPLEEIERTRELYAEALEIARSVNDPEEAGMVLQWWAHRETQAGSLDEAIRLAQQALPVADRDTQMYLHNQIAGWMLALGRIEDAEPYARESLVRALETQHPLARAQAIAYIAPLQAARDPQRAALLFGYAKARLDELDWEPEENDKRTLQTIDGVLERASTNGDYAALLARGALLTEHQALEALGV